MPIPPNTTALTATPITLPASFTQNASDGAGTNYSLWYSFVAPAGAQEVGAWGNDGTTGTGYQPDCIPYTGPASAPTQILGIDGTNTPIQFPVVPGQTYLIQFSPESNTQPAILTVSVLVAPTTTPVAGNLLIPDDTAGFPLAIISDTADYTLIAFVPGFPNGEQGDSLQALGVLLMYDGAGTTNFFLYTSAFSLLATIPRMDATAGFVRGNPTLGKFYIATQGQTSPALATDYRSVDAAGNLGPIGTISDGLAGLGAICPNNTETILYYARQGNNAPVRQWDLVNHVALGNLVAGVPNYAITDILCFPDTSLVVSYFNGATGDFYAVHYSAAGATLATYLFGIGLTETFPRLAYGPDGTNSFWAWFHLSNGGDQISRLVQTSLTTNTILATRNQKEYENGVYTGIEPSAPLARFGISFSCPFFLFPSIATPLPPAEGPPACPLGVDFIGLSGGPVARIPWTSENS